MSLFKVFRSEPRYIRRTRAYLQEARMAALEHSIAAEHYRSSAQMYAERAQRLEEEIAMFEAVRDGLPLTVAPAEPAPEAATCYPHHSEQKVALAGPSSVGMAAPL